MQEAEALDFLKGHTITYKSDAELMELYRGCAKRAASMPPRSMDAALADIEGFPEKLREVAADRWMLKVIEGKTWTFKRVEIDKLVCLQKYINVDYAEGLDRGQDLSSLPVAMDFFLTDKFLHHMTKDTNEPSVNLYAIHSEGTDMRVLGSTETVDSSDSTKVVSFRIGWGPPQTQVVHLRDRYILANGYHRAFLSRLRGERMMPCVLIDGKNYSDLDSSGQPVFFGEELVMSDRPPMFVDFFSESISPIVRMRPMGKVVVLQPDEFELSPEQAPGYLEALPSIRGPIELNVTMKTQFENVTIAKEDWNQYFLDDGTMLFMRQIMNKVKVIIGQKGEISYQPVLSEPIAAPVCPDGLMGPPSAEKWTEDELKTSVAVRRLGFKRIVEATNEYVLWNNDKVTLTMRLIGVSKTNRFNELGEPIYLYDTIPTTGFIGGTS